MISYIKFYAIFLYNFHVNFKYLIDYALAISEIAKAPYSEGKVILKNQLQVKF